MVFKSSPVLHPSVVDEIGLLHRIAQVVTVNRLAREYNAGLQAAQDAVQAQNDQLSVELADAGVDVKFIKKSLIPVPMPCPENLDMKFVRKYLAAFNWRKSSRNTSGNYLVFRQHIRHDS